jgi:hypothetical protein
VSMPSEFSKHILHSDTRFFRSTSCCVQSHTKHCFFFSQMLDDRRNEIGAAKNEQKLDDIESQFPVDRLDLLHQTWLSSALRRALAINSASTMNNMVSPLSILLQLHTQTLSVWYAQ